MKSAEGGFRVFSLAVVTIALAVFAGVGYLVGRVERTSQANAANVRAGAASATYRRAKTAAYHRGFRAQYRRGVSAGATSGSKTGARLGRSAGRAAATSLAITDQAKALAATLASTPVSLKRTTRTRTCVPVGGGLCEVLGPGVTGKRCPRASAPSVEGGIVCIPQVLVQAAQAAGVPGAGALSGAVASTGSGDAAPSTESGGAVPSTGSGGAVPSTGSGVATATPAASSTTP